MLATLLDPRFKNKFFSGSVEWDEAKSLLTVNLRVVKCSTIVSTQNNYLLSVDL